MRTIPFLLLFLGLASASAAAEGIVTPSSAAGPANDFAFRLYRQLAARDGDVAFSPLSVHLALSMTSAGARGETAAEMRRVLALPAARKRVALAAKLLEESLTTPEGGNERSPDTPTEVTIANALFAQEGYRYLAPFLETMKTAYGAPLRRVDFAGATEAARRTINGWVFEKTNERIEDLLAPDVLNANSRLVLVNALTFKASWRTPFRERATKPQPFLLAGGAAVDVPTMRRTGPMRHAETEALHAVDLSYGQGRFSMLLLVPKARDGLAAVEKTLSAKSIAVLVSGLRNRSVALALPRWKTTTSFSLAAPLKQLGMKTAFGIGADFSGMDGTKDLFVSAVEHKAFVEVDEQGTEAAAATAVAMGLKGRPREPVAVRADRPFLYAIRDRKTGAILFLGRVADPR